MHAEKRTLLVAAMTVLGLVFLAGAVAILLVPSLKRVNDLNGKVLDAQAELEAQYANRRDLLRSLELVREIRETADALAREFIRPGEELLFITRVEEIGERRGAATEIRLAQSRAGAGANDAFELRFRGPWEAVHLALVDLERLENIVLIDSVGIVAGEVRPGEAATATMSVRGRIVFTP